MTVSLLGRWLLRRELLLRWLFHVRLLLLLGRVLAILLGLLGWCHLLLLLLLLRVRLLRLLLGVLRLLRLLGKLLSCLLLWVSRLLAVLRLLGHRSCNILRLHHWVRHLLSSAILVDRFADSKIGVVVASLLRIDSFRGGLGGRLGNRLLIHLPLMLLGDHHGLLVLTGWRVYINRGRKVDRLGHSWSPVGRGLYLLLRNDCHGRL